MKRQLTTSRSIFTICGSADYITDCGDTADVYFDALQRRIERISDQFWRFLPKGFQAAIQVALFMPDLDGEPDEVLDCDKEFIEECRRSRCWTVADYYFVVSTKEGQSGNFAKVKMHTLQRVPGLDATGQWDYGEFLKHLTQYGASGGRMAAWEHLAVGKAYKTIAEIPKASHEYVRDMADLTAFKGGIRIPFSGQTDGRLLADGEIRISFSALSEEQDLVMALMLKDVFKEHLTACVDAVNGHAHSVFCYDARLTLNLDDELLYKISPTAAFYQMAMDVYAEHANTCHIFDRD